MSYKDSSVLITGASQGIGRSVAITFAKETKRPLLLLSRDIKKLEETKKLCESAGATKIEILICDAASTKEVNNLILPRNFPQPGILINNAGGYLYKPLAETSNKEFMEQINLNLFTAINMVNRFLPDLKKMNRAYIVNICSIASLRGFADSGAYAASKHALLGYTRSLREELKKTDIAVTAVNLGQTHSSSWDESTMSPARLINPTDLAALIVTMSEFSPRTVVEEVTIQPQHGRVTPV